VELPWSNSVTRLPYVPVRRLFKKPQAVSIETSDPITPSPAHSESLRADVRKASLSTRPFTSDRRAIKNLVTIPLKVIKSVPQIVWSETQKLESFRRRRNTLYANTSTIVGPLQEGVE
jgi:hypothetical protein